jgi:PEP-CTERM motif-containing protein
MKRWGSGRLLFIGALVALVLVGGLASPTVSQAVPVLTVTNHNSTIQVDGGSSAGMFTWTVDGVDQMFQQSFWFRVGATGGESNISALPLIASSAAGRNIDLEYSNGALDIEVTYTLGGGAAGSGKADVGELITINNTSRSAIDLHFFEYSDFDLNGQIGDQTATFRSPQAFRQSGAGTALTETVVTPAPNRHEAGIFANTLNSLQDGAPTTLNNVNSAGPGDATWAFEWDTTIGAGGSFQVSKDKNITSVPEPATLVLLGAGLFGMGLVARKRSS